MESESKTRRVGLGALGVGLLLAGSALSLGCPPPIIAEDADAGVEDPALDPRGLFETTVKNDIVAGCACHQLTYNGVAPFFSSGSEYATITTYQNGRFLTTNPDVSLLLTKGQHMGPALEASLATRVRTWLQAESVARGSQGSPTTPTVAIRNGDFYISLQTLVNDPLAKITFRLDSFGAQSYRISNLKMTSGPTGDVHLKHPRFIIFSATGATPDPSDALSNVDQTTTASMTANIGAGTVLLSNLPATTARLALAFQTVEKLNGNTTIVTCKNFANFYPAVTSKLATCAAICHSPTGSDPRFSQANGAFNMSAAQGTDMAGLQQLCVYSLARLNMANIAQSVLITQAQPAASGGTANHPYKLDSVSFPPYQNVVTTWGNGEK